MASKWTPLASGSERFRKRARRKTKARAKETVGESSLERPFQFKKSTVITPEERKSRMNVPPGRAVLDCGTAESLAGVSPAAMLAQACEYRGRKVGDDRKVEALEEKYNVRGAGEQVITPFIRLQVPGTLGRQDVHRASLMAARHHWLEMTLCFREVHQSICILVIAGWRFREEESRQR